MKISNKLKAFCTKTLIMLLLQKFSIAQSLTTYLYDANGNCISKQVRGSSPNPTVTASPEAASPTQPSTLMATGCTGGTVQWMPGNLQGSQVTVNQSVTTQYTASCIVSGCAINGTGKVTVNIIQCPNVTISAVSNAPSVRYGSQVILYANGCNIIENGVNVGKVTWSTGAIGSPSYVKFYGPSNTFTATCSSPYCPNISSASVTVGGITGCNPGDVLLTAQAGNWTATTTWTCGRIPAINDEVYLNHQVQVNANGSTKGIILGSGFLNYPNTSFITLPQN